MRYLDRSVYDSGPQVVVGVRQVNSTPVEFRLTLQIGQSTGDSDDHGPVVLTEEAALRVIDALQKGLVALFEARSRSPDPL